MGLEEGLGDEVGVVCLLTFLVAILGTSLRGASGVTYSLFGYTLVG